MPFARVTLFPAPAPEIATALAADVTALIAAVLRKRHELTSVLIESPVGLWTIGDRAQPVAAVLEVRVTAGSNSGEEKREFLKQAMDLLRGALPGLDPASYVIITEIPGTDWGYDGQSQADRARRA